MSLSLIRFTADGIFTSGTGVLRGPEIELRVNNASAGIDTTPASMALSPATLLTTTSGGIAASNVMATDIAPWVAQEGSSFVGPECRL